MSDKSFLLTRHCISMASGFGGYTRSRQSVTTTPPPDDEGWESLRSEILGVFTPGAPIDEFALFAGRQTQIQRLSDAVVSKGRHAALFGERGVGKTSLANIFYFGLPNPKRVVHVYVQCGSADTYEQIWTKALRRIIFHIDGREYIAADLVRGTVTPDELEVVLANFSGGHTPVIVFDEFDRIRDRDVAGLMSETIKHLSNSTVSCTIVLVGVADSVTDLISEHQSISRALVQIKMPRMDADELKEIVTSRLHGTPITITGDALWRISYLASGLPF
jgi:Cdc6-like AAA superfamily ATPase